jgi:hypothetical protein
LATSAAGSDCGAAIPRCDGVTAARSRLCAEPKAGKASKAKAATAPDEA